MRISARHRYQLFNIVLLSNRLVDKNTNLERESIGLQISENKALKELPIGRQVQVYGLRTVRRYSELLFY